MNIYKISQYINNKDEAFESAIVVSENEHTAKLINPGDVNLEYLNGEWENLDDYIVNPFIDNWVLPNDVIVKFLGVAPKGTKPCLVLTKRNNP